MLVALKRPDLVSGLVLVGGASRGAPSMQRRIEGFLSGDLAAYHLQHLRDCVTPAFAASERGAWLLSLFHDQAGQLSGACIANIFRARLACDLTERLGAISAPTLVVNGACDVSLAAGRLTSGLIPKARHAVIPDAGHACNLEAPEAFGALAASFLRELTGAG